MTFRLWLLVLLHKVGPDLLGQRSSGFEVQVLAIGILQVLFEHLLDIEVLVDGISGWHHVVDIHVFNKAFHGGNSFLDLLLSHSFTDALWVSGDASNKGMRVFGILR